MTIKKGISKEGQCSRNEMKALDRIHYLAQWECMFHVAKIFNEILDCPFAYTSLGRLFSATVFQSYFVKSPDRLLTSLSPIGRALFAAITDGVLPEIISESRPILPQKQETTASSE